MVGVCVEGKKKWKGKNELYYALAGSDQGIVSALFGTLLLAAKERIEAAVVGEQWRTDGDGFSKKKKKLKVGGVIF